MQKKVMIIEDNEMLSDMYNFKLWIEWYKVFVENNSETALANFKKFEPDIILLDLMMPIVSGFDILKTIKQDLKSDVKIIVLSNLNGTGDKEKALSLGADKYILKSSLSPKDLIPEIKELLQK